MSQAEVGTKIKIDNEIKEPPMFRVIYINDNKTSVDFVIQSLIEFFNYNENTATKITQEIHESGSSIVAILPYEIAEQKGIEVTISARSLEYPLQIKLEPEPN